MNNSDDDDYNQPTIIIIGAGPAGLSAALALANAGYKSVHVYEKRSAASLQQTSWGESYPVGLNRRGLQALQGLLLLQQDQHQAITKRLGNQRITSFEIFVGPWEWRVATFPCGKTLFATTRSRIVQLLLEAVENRHTDAITIHYEHAVTALNMTNQTVTFQSQNDNACDTTQMIITRRADALIVADGYASKSRSMLQQQARPDELQVRQWPWNTNFRVLLSPPNIKVAPDKDTRSKKLQPTAHHICNGIYIAKTTAMTNDRWVAVLSASGSSNAFWQSREATDTHVQQLQQHVAQKAPMFDNLMARNQQDKDKDEYKQFFSRPIFTGAVTWASSLTIQNWAVLMGDAAHGVIPATGEGVNSSLEDGWIWQQVLLAGGEPLSFHGSKSLQQAMETFNAQRLPDVQALSEFAYSMVRPTWWSIVQKIMLRLLGRWLSCSNILRHHPVQHVMFGPGSDEQVLSYSAIMREWDQQLYYLGGRPRIPAVQA